MSVTLGAGTHRALSRPRSMDFGRAGLESSGSRAVNGLISSTQSGFRRASAALSRRAFQPAGGSFCLRSQLLSTLSTPVAFLIGANSSPGRSRTRCSRGTWAGRRRQTAPASRRWAPGSIGARSPVDAGTSSPPGAREGEHPVRVEPLDEGDGDRVHGDRSGEEPQRPSASFCR